MNVTKWIWAAAGVASGVMLIAGPPAVGAKMLPPCQEGNDEQVSCVWDAKHMGNGVGSSYKITGKGEQVFIGHRRAHRLAYGS